jgi:hypothetical protein
MANEVWIADIVDLQLDGTGARVELTSGGKRKILRCSRHTLVKGLGLAQVALKGRIDAEVVALRKRPPGRH